MCSNPRLLALALAALMLALTAPHLVAQPTEVPLLPGQPAPTTGPPALLAGGVTAGATAGAEEVVGAFLQGTAAQYQELARLLADKYPALTREVAQFVFSQQPDVLLQLSPCLFPLLQTKYPDVVGIIVEVIAGNNALQLRVSALVTQQYPQFLTDLAGLPAGPDRGAQAGELVSKKYPDLTRALVSLVQKEFPDTVTQIRDRIVARYPEFIGDIAKLMARTFPRLTAKLLNFIVHHCPQLLPQLMAILYGQGPAATAPPATTPPAGGVEPPPPDTTVTPPPPDTPA